MRRILLWAMIRYVSVFSSIKRTVSVKTYLDQIVNFMPHLCVKFQSDYKPEDV